MCISNNNRWVATVASIWIQATVGEIYVFGVYSPIIRSSQSYDQSTLDTLSVVKDIGGNVGVFAGLLYSATATSSGSHRWNCIHGPWVVLLTGAIQCFLGYFFIWLAVVGLIPQPPLPLMCLFMFLASQGPTFLSTANVVTSVLNFPGYSGTIVGIMKGIVGLTGAIFIQVYQAFFNGNQSNFILMLALLPTIVALALICFVKIYPASRSSVDNWHLTRFSLVGLVLAIFLMIIIILENVVEFPQLAHRVTVMIILLILLSPLKIALEAVSEEDSKSLPVERESPTNNIYLKEREKFVDEKNEYEELPSFPTVIEPAEDSMDILQAMQTLNFWLLFVSMSCGMGSGLATINNISQLGQSLGYEMVHINTLISLWSIWNYFGRFGAGYMSDILLRHKCLARPLMIALFLATMTVGHVIISLGFSGNLYIGTILIGICFGAQWSLMPTITAEIFGVQHMGTIFNTIGIASPMGAYFLSVWVIGYLYDKEAGEDKSCNGVHCFMVSFLILASVCLLGFFVALTLFFRTRAFYKNVVLRRLCILKDGLS